MLDFAEPQFLLEIGIVAAADIAAIVVATKVLRLNPVLAIVGGTLVGTAGGSAIADVLFGDSTPLTAAVTFAVLVAFFGILGAIAWWIARRRNRTEPS